MQKIFFLVLAAFAPAMAWAGPPFLTDDSETVQYLHGEVLIVSQYANNKDGKVGTAPYVEANYGIFPDVQLHLLLPLAYSRPNGGPTAYGLGDTELGVKYRFHETDSLQVATLPLVRIPTGDSDRGLGGGHVPAFLPLWLQKSWEPWTTYGGGGYWFNPGAGNKDFWQVGWVVQREINKTLALGAEMFYLGKDTTDGRDQTGCTIGWIVNVSEAHHILFSAGSDIAGDNRFSAFLGYQWIFGPKEKGEK